jgi:nicotinamide phosphoribosyltransferase
MNQILRTDSYKTSHFNQYPLGATRVSSYIEPRGGKFDTVTFFGLQAFIKQYLLTPIGLADILEAKEVCEMHGVPFNLADWRRILDVHGGYLPIEISAMPEGTVMGIQNAVVQVVNTDPELPWLTSYIETALLRAIWYPSTVATLSRKMKGHIYEALKLTSDDPEGQLPFKLHDFGARGATSSESAMLGGMGHLVNFMGTDTLEAVVGMRRYYNERMAAFSIPATEHSTMTSWGRECEGDAYENLLTQYPTGLVSCVIDSYDTMNAVTNIFGGVLKDKVLARDGVLILRPDSGNPTTMVLDVLDRAMDAFGFTVNSKGFRVLNPKVRAIQGDGMDEVSIPNLLSNAYDRGISVDNFAMGMGGGLLQKVDRDTMKWAMKANAIEIDGVWHDVFKDPITDQVKRSKRGRQAVIEHADRTGPQRFSTVSMADMITSGIDPRCNRLRPVYRDGKLLVDEALDVIRERAKL